MEKRIKQAYEMAKNNGFWDTERNVPEMLMLVVSELSEALEALRKGKYSDPFMAQQLMDDLYHDSHDEEFSINQKEWKKSFEEKIKSGFEDELADVAIRLFDICGGMKIDLEKHIDLKMKYNSMRPYKHGKKF